MTDQKGAGGGAAKKDAGSSSSSKKYADDERHGTPKEEDVAAEAVTADGSKAKIDKHGRPETHDAYEG
jgi:hypothetical protein